MEIKKTLMFTLAILLLISGGVLVSAITGSIGNAKMVLYPEVNGWTNTVIEKTILVRNVNDVPVNVTLKLDQNASKFIELIDESFILEAGEEKKAQIEIAVKKEGKYDGRVNVFFKSVEGEEAGVVLASNIVVIANKKTGYESEEDNTDTTDNTPEENTEETNPENIGGKTGPSKLVKFWGASTLILLVILLVLLYIWGKKRNKSKGKRKSK
jgi:hypothetical protein